MTTKNRSKFIQILRWPEKIDANTNRPPWFVILWRLLLVPFIFIPAIILWVGIYLTYGKEHAKRFWRLNM